MQSSEYKDASSVNYPPDTAAESGSSPHCVVTESRLSDDVRCVSSGSAVSPELREGEREREGGEFRRLVVT